MNKSTEIKSKFNTPDLLKLSAVTLALSLLLGGYARANAESAQKDEVLSIPPQEAFYIQQKTPSPSETPDKNSLSNRAALTRASNNLKTGHNLPPIRNCVSSTAPQK